MDTHAEWEMNSTPPRLPYHQRNGNILWATTPLKTTPMTTHVDTMIHDDTNNFYRDMEQKDDKPESTTRSCYVLMAPVETQVQLQAALLQATPLDGNSSTGNSNPPGLSPTEGGDNTLLQFPDQVDHNNGQDLSHPNRQKRTTHRTQV